MLANYQDGFHGSDHFYLARIRQKVMALEFSLPHFSPKEGRGS
jgi:hypothetical protein